MRYDFQPFSLDTERGLLLKARVDVAIEPRAFKLLSFLVVNQDRLVTKDEIIEKIWRGRLVSDAAISTVIKTTRKVLADDGVKQKYIQTIRGRGFRFVGTAIAVLPARAKTAENIVPPGDKLAASHRPSIAILPFRLVGYSEAYSAIADAIPTELISCL